MNKLIIPNIDLNSAFDIGVRPVPGIGLGLMAIEQWYGWRSNSTGFINTNNNFSGTNSIEVKEKCIERPAMAFTYFAWTEITEPHQVKIARLVMK